MRKRFGLLCMILGALLLAAALLLVAYNRYEDMRAGQEAQEALTELQAAMASATARPETEESAQPETVPAAESDPAQPESAGGEQPEASLGEDEYSGYIGYLSVPDLGLTLPILGEWSYPALRKAPCRFYGSVEDENLVIVAHNYSRHFGNLHRLVAGDLVTFTDVDGVQTVYAVAEVKNMEPTAVAEAADGAYPLTLVTCTPGGKMRVCVRCAFADDAVQSPVDAAP